MILKKRTFTSLCNGRSVWSWQAIAGIPVKKGEMESLDIRDACDALSQPCLHFLLSCVVVTQPSTKKNEMDSTWLLFMSE